MSCIVCVFPLSAAWSQGQEAALVQVVYPKKTQRAPQRSFSGTVTSQRRASLSPRISGLVKTADADVGFNARQGDLLVELDTTLAQFEASQARERLNEARLQLAELQRQQKEGGSLLAKRAISATEAQNRDAQAKIQAAVVSRLETEYALYNERVERHNIFAPFDGVVVSKLAEVGEWVETGTAVLELIDTNRLRLDVQVPQQHYSLIQMNQSVSVSIDAIGAHKIVGNIIAKAPLSDRNARTFLVRVALQRGQHQVIPGMSARALFSLSDQYEALMVPRDALKRYPDGTISVWVVVDDQGVLKAHEKRIQVLASRDENIRVEQGITEQDRVVIRGNEMLREGQTVRLVQNAKVTQLPAQQGK